MSRRAFTLIEMLVVIALAAALLASLFGFLYDMLGARRRGLEFSERQRAATTLIERLEADLIACFVGDDVTGAGVQGDESSLTLLLRGVPVQLAERGADDPLVFIDLIEASYRFDESRQSIEMKRGVPGDAESSSDYAPLGQAIYLVRFRYHDGSSWQSSFDSLAADRLPRAVEVAVWFDPWPGAAPRDEPPRDDALAADGFEPERLTFDAGGGFDEEAFAASSDLEFFDEPTPDRIRVIVVPDAEEKEAGEGGLDDALARGGAER